MPIILTADTQPGGGTSIPRIDKRDKVQYRYPRGINMTPGTEVHDRIAALIRRCAFESHSRMSARYDGWNDIDETLTAYIPLDDLELKIKDKDSRKPVSIVVPVSFATLDTLLTYVTAAFLESPIFRYSGTGAEDMLGAMLLENLIDMQARRAKMGLALHTMFRDAFAYGFGAVSPVWTRKTGWKTRTTMDGIDTMSGFMPTDMVREREEVVQFEGNELLNVDPYCYLPDVSVPINEPQRGNYVGWWMRDNHMNLLRRERDGGYFNCQYLKKYSGKSFLGQENSRRDPKGVRTDLSGTEDVWKRIDVIYMYMDIIPAEMGVGLSTAPEKWLFALAGDNVVIKADPQGADHGMFPVGVCAPDYDGYSVAPISRLEMVYGMQTFMNFLYNSHIANVRKAIQDMFVADPSLVNMNDLMNPRPGKIIRLRKKAWGKGVNEAVSQMKVTDVTSAHLAEALGVMNMTDQVTGAVDSLKGQIKGGERRSAAEFNQTRSSALSRLERMAKIAGMQANYDVAYMAASHTQQFMTTEQYVRMVGRNEQDLRDVFGDADRILVSPLDLSIDYDVEISDGTLPSSGDPQVWLQAFQTVAADPELRQTFSVTGIFKYLARLAGAKNLPDFVNRQPIQSQVLPDEEVAAEAQKGNLVPIGRQG